MIAKFSAPLAVILLATGPTPLLAAGIGYDAILHLRFEA
jgi:hypothetical protein